MSQHDEDFQQNEYKYDRRKIKSQLKNGDYEDALEESEAEAEFTRRRPKKPPFSPLTKSNKPQRKDNGKRNFFDGLYD